MYVYAIQVKVWHLMVTGERSAGSSNEQPQHRDSRTQYWKQHIEVNEREWSMKLDEHKSFHFLYNSFVCVLKVKYI